MELTYQRATEILDELVDEKGADYIYTEDPKSIETKNELGMTPDASINGCYYNHLDGTPGCIVGHLVHKLNPEFDLSSGNILGNFLFFFQKIL